MSWNSNYVELKANTEKEHHIVGQANIIYIVNNSNFPVYVDLEKANASHFEEMAPSQGKAILIRKSQIAKIRLFSTGDANIVVHEIQEDALKFLILLSSVQGQVSIMATVGLKAGELNIDGDKDLQVDVKTTAGLKAGELNIDGDKDLQVDVKTLPAWTWKKLTAAGAGDIEVKATPGAIAMLAVEGGVSVYVKDGTDQAFAATTTEQNFGYGLECLTSIQVNFAAAGTAWVLYR